MTKLRQRTNGDTSKPAWEEADDLDRLADKLTDPGSILDDVMEEVPPMATPKLERRPAPLAPKQKTINVKEMLDTLLQAYTANDVHMWVENNELCFEQIVENGGQLYKNSFRLKVASFVTSSVKLIK